MKHNYLLNIFQFFLCLLLFSPWKESEENQQQDDQLSRYGIEQYGTVESIFGQGLVDYLARCLYEGNVQYITDHQKRLTYTKFPPVIQWGITMQEPAYHFVY